MQNKGVRIVWQMGSVISGTSYLYHQQDTELIR